MSERSVWDRLSEPFAVEDLEWRVGSTTADKKKGMALIYVTARAVMDRLDDVLGPENWQDFYAPLGADGFLCTLQVRVNGEWLTKTDGAARTQVEGVKGGISDSLKRAAVKLGIGRYLYGLPDFWAPIEQRGKGYAIARDWRPSLPADALPRRQGSSKPAQRTHEERGPKPSAEPAPSDPVDAVAAAEEFQAFLDEPQTSGTPPSAEQLAMVQWPAWADEPLGFSKQHAARTWREMAQGGPQGGRRQFLRYLEREATERWKAKKLMPTPHEARAIDMLSALRRESLEAPRPK